MHRFFCPQENFIQTTLTITDQKEIHHLKNVLRLKEGDRIVLFNGQGKEADATITSIAENAIEVSLSDIRQDEKKNFTIILACAIPKKAKFESIIEKCTELGVDEIIPLKTQRTEVIFSKEKMPDKVKRFQTVAINASKQSNRKTIPAIHPVLSLSEALKHIDNSTLALIPHLSGKRKSLHEIMSQNPHAKKIMFFIGPEGDFTPEEIALAIKSGSIAVSLGETTLKVDTAAISVVAFAQLLLADEK
ncbi:MAG: RsmE family RNA methyltransferase [Candidatus Omnitrophota bacterium]